METSTVEGSEDRTPRLIIELIGSSSSITVGISANLPERQVPLPKKVEPVFLGPENNEVISAAKTIVLLLAADMQGLVRHATQYTQISNGKFQAWAMVDVVAGDTEIEKRYILYGEHHDCPFHARHSAARQMLRFLSIYQYTGRAHEFLSSEHAKQAVEKYSQI